MYPIYVKELTGFFSSLTGYLVIAVFLVVNSLFMWVFPGELNIPESGYASLDTIFLISPWVFLFLVPAVTMRMLSEEKRLGTIELLFSRPLNEYRIVAGKFLAAVTLVLLSLLPLAVSYLTVWFTGNPPGNLDTGGTWGIHDRPLFSRLSLCINRYCSHLFPYGKPGDSIHRGCDNLLPDVRRL
jgi:ABC-2 type transport system permease protein